MLISQFTWVNLILAATSIWDPRLFQQSLLHNSLTNMPALTDSQAQNTEWVREHHTSILKPCLEFKNRISCLYNTWKTFMDQKWSSKIFTLKSGSWKCTFSDLTIVYFTCALIPMKEYAPFAVPIPTFILFDGVAAGSNPWFVLSLLKRATCCSFTKEEHSLSIFIASSPRAGKLRDA